MRRVIFAAALAVAGAELLVQWGRIWSLEPDLAWGWGVPLLVGYFLWSRWKDRPDWLSPKVGRMADVGHSASVVPNTPNFEIARGFPFVRAKQAYWGQSAPPPIFIAAAIAAALTIFPLSRLLLEPFPGWPLAEWAHSIVIVGLILALIAAEQGVPRARHLAWPLVFGMAALPWPAFIAVGAIGHLRVGLAALVTEALNFFGEPAMSTGTVIQVGSGFLGIDEACGGIRSLQAAVMVALAIGELRRDRGARRLGWLGLAIGLALAANLLRIAALALICARAGMGALGVWHDRVAALEMILVLGGLAVFAFRAGVPVPTARAAAPAAETEKWPVGPPALAVFVITVIVLTEGATLAWFGSGDARQRAAARWGAHLPAQLASYSADPFAPVMQELLACDAHQLGHWSAPSGARRAGFVIEWHRGHTAQYAVRLHNPDICLDLAGSELVAAEPNETVRIGSFQLPFSVREFRRGQEIYFVYFLAWNISAAQPLAMTATAADTSRSWFGRQWAEVRARRRNLEARMLALAIFDEPNAAAADRAFHTETSRILHLGR